MRTAAVVLGILAAAPAAWSMDLLDTWRAAAAHDPEYAAAQSSRAAGAALAREASALWRPTVGLEAGIGWASSENATRGAQFAAPSFGTSSGVSFDTSITHGTSTRYALVLRQPLYNRERDAQAQQLRSGADVAQAGWRDAQQALIVRSAEHYLDVALAEQQVRLLREQEAAVARARTEAEDRFRIGDQPVTAVHEATARAEGLVAQRLAAESDLELKRAQFADFTGEPAPGGFLLPGTPAGTAAGDLAAWLARAEADNPQLQQARAKLASAGQEARKTAAVVSPTLDLVAQASRDRLSGHGDFGDASQSMTQRAIGVQLSVPLYTGGWRSAKHDESVAQAEAARAGLELARQRIAQQVRAAWLELSVGERRVAALQAGWTASLARLDATRTGVQAGDRTTLDLLNAQNDAAAAELQLLQARARQLTSRLRLAALAGGLGEAELAQANRELVAPAAR